MFRFLIYNIKYNSSPTLTYSNLSLFNTASFHLLIYNINMTLSATLMYFNIFHVTIVSFNLRIHNLSITFSLTLTNSNIILFTTDFFTSLWYVSIKILIIVFTYCSTKHVCFGEVLDVFFFLLFLAFFFSVQFFIFRCTLLTKLIFHYHIYLKTFLT